MSTFFNDKYQVRDSPASASQVSVQPILEFARRLAFHADPRQAEVLQSSAKRGILNCTRQWGKSTVAAVKALHAAYTEPESLVLVASPCERQSAEFLNKTTQLVRKLDIRPKGDGKNSCSLLLPNGSRIIGLPGTEETVRGFASVKLLLIDEASRVDDSLYTALRPMLAVGGGGLWMMSTPNGRRGFFYQCWSESSEEWHRISVPATECPRIPPAFLEIELREMGTAAFRQEYLCEFAEDHRQMFSRELLRNALRDIPPVLGSEPRP